MLVGVVVFPLGKVADVAVHRDTGCPGLVGRQDDRPQTGPRDLLPRRPAVRLFRPVLVYWLKQLELQLLGHPPRLFRWALPDRTAAIFSLGACL